MKRKKAWIRALIPTIAAAAFLGLAFMNKSRAASPAYHIETLSRGDIESLIATSGTLAAIDTVDVGSQVSGKIVRLYADYNSVVKAGQVVAEIDPEILVSKVALRQANSDSAAAVLEQAKTELETARKKFERVGNLHQSRLVSAEAYETAQSAFAAARAAVRIAEGDATQALSTLQSSRVDLAYSTVRTPISGTVISRVVSVGQTVAASYEPPVLFKIASDLRKMQVLCSIDEAVIGQVKEGQSVRFTVGAFPDESFNGRISQVRNSAATSSNVVTYTAVVEAENPQLILRPGMTAAVQIVAARARNIVRIPSSALNFKPTTLTDEQTNQAARLRRSLKPGWRLVWVMNAGGVLEPRAVTVGIADKTYSEAAAGGLQAGQKIVTGFQTAADATALSAQDGPPMPPPDGMMPPPPPIK
jgi:HlyD family secretion protein